MIDGKQVEAIEYTSHEEMALQQMTVIREAIFAKYMILRSFQEPEWRPNRPKIN
jgi:molybdopterin synthase catalytic subunit